MKELIYVALGCIFVFLIFFLFRKTRLKADVYLVATNVILFVFLLSYLSSTEQLQVWNYLLVNLMPFWLFPTFLSYGLSLIDSETPPFRRYPWIFFFAIVFTIYFLVDVLLVGKYSTAELEHLYLEPNVFQHIFFKSNKIFAIVVMLWFLKQLRGYYKKVSNNYSYIEGLQLGWLRNFMIVIIANYSFSLIAFILYNFKILGSIELVYLLVNLGILLAVFYLTYYGIQQYNVAQFENAMSGKGIRNTAAGKNQGRVDESSKYVTSPLSEAQIESYYTQLVELFDKEKIYREPKLKVDQVAIRLNIRTHYLSQVINTRYESSFYDFVNRYRVGELKDKLQDPKNDNLTILALAYDAGFNSKASLNRIFKEYTGITPSQFKSKLHRKSS